MNTTNTSNTTNTTNTTAEEGEEEKSNTTIYIGGSIGIIVALGLIACIAAKGISKKAPVKDLSLHHKRDSSKI